MSGDRSNREHYTEQVVLFDGQSISFPYHETHPQQSPALAQGDAIKSITALGHHTMVAFVSEYDNITGIPITTGPIYLCFQNLFKIHPVLDNIFLKILQVDNDGHVVLQAARDNGKTVKLMHRIQNTAVQKLCFDLGARNDGIDICDEAARILSRIHFVPRVQSQNLQHIYERADVVLHPFPFGGSKTASDAFKFGTPLVTFPQPYLRGQYFQHIKSLIPFEHCW